MNYWNLKQFWEITKSRNSKTRPLGQNRGSPRAVRPTSTRAAQRDRPRQPWLAAARRWRRSARVGQRRLTPTEKGYISTEHGEHGGEVDGARSWPERRRQRATAEGDVRRHSTDGTEHKKCHRFFLELRERERITIMEPFDVEAGQKLVFVVVVEAAVRWSSRNRWNCREPVHR